MAANQAYYLCIKHLDKSCKSPMCKNVHPDDVIRANEEYHKKQMPRICYKFNFDQNGCPFERCKYLHIYIKPHTNMKAIQQTMAPLRIDNLLSNIRSNVVYVDTLIAKMRVDSDNFGIPIQEDLLKFQENIYENLGKILSNLNTNLTNMTSNNTAQRQ